MRASIRAGEVIETATPAEVRHEMNSAMADWFQEAARGVQPWRYESEPVTVANTAVTIPSSGQLRCGPNPGFCVLVTVLRCIGLAQTDVSLDKMQVYRNSTSTMPVEEFGTPNAGGSTFQLIRTSGKSLFLNSDDHLIFAGTGLTATGDIQVSAEGIEIPAPDLYKILA